MKFTKNKTMAIMIATILTISMGASMTLIPNANAHKPALNIPTESYINVAPNPIGVGQAATINFWLAQPPPTANQQFGDRWTGITVTVTNPDGTTQKLGPFTSDDTGGTTTSFTSSATGNYTFQMFFPGQTLTNNNPQPVGSLSSAILAYVGDYYQPSNSTITTLTVQEAAISTAYPITPFPTNYWTRPINAMNLIGIQ
jgi:hypothetical protein